MSKHERRDLQAKEFAESLPRRSKWRIDFQKSERFAFPTPGAAKLKGQLQSYIRRDAKGIVVKKDPISGAEFKTAKFPELQKVDTRAGKPECKKATGQQWQIMIEESRSNTALSRSLERKHPAFERYASHPISDTEEKPEEHGNVDSYFQSSLLDRAVEDTYNDSILIKGQGYVPINRHHETEELVPPIEPGKLDGPARRDIITDIVRFNTSVTPMDESRRRLLLWKGESEYLIKIVDAETGGLVTSFYLHDIKIIRFAMLYDLHHLMFTYFQGDEGLDATIVMDIRAPSGSFFELKRCCYAAKVTPQQVCNSAEVVEFEEERKKILKLHDSSTIKFGNPARNTASQNRGIDRRRRNTVNNGTHASRTGQHSHVSFQEEERPIIAGDRRTHPHTLEPELPMTTSDSNGSPMFVSPATSDDGIPEEEERSKLATYDTMIGREALKRKGYDSSDSELSITEEPFLEKHVRDMTRSKRRSTIPNSEDERAMAQHASTAGFQPLTDPDDLPLSVLLARDQARRGGESSGRRSMGRENMGWGSTFQEEIRFQPEPHLSRPMETLNRYPREEQRGSSSAFARFPTVHEDEDMDSSGFVQPFSTDDPNEDVDMADRP